MLDPGPIFARRLLRWYDRAQRALPWRTAAMSKGRPDPYPVLVSEAMLQQTQVAAVVPYFHRFMARFPTLECLAQADQQDVLRLWQGLGYYSRARNLHAAAITVVRDFDGKIPATADELLALPGVGRYTAGAVASIAFGQRTPILDGNVQRVLCRLDCIKTDPRDRQTNAMLWRRAEEILPKNRVGDFNSALMELGATICTPKSPQCLLCPVRKHCRAFAEGLQERIPLPKPSRPTPLHVRHTYCIRHDGKWLMEQRPPKGRWAGMWQFLTLADALTPSPGTPGEGWGEGLSSAEIEDPHPNPLPRVRGRRDQRATANAHLILPLKTSTPKPIGTIEHALTHRRYRFEVFVCQVLSKEEPKEVLPRRWLTLKGLNDFPLPRPHVKIAEMLSNLD